MTVPVRSDTRQAGQHFFNDSDIDSRGYESAAHNVYAAPGYQVALEGWSNARRQLLFIDPDEVDELCRRLHQAKRYAREAVR